MLRDWYPANTVDITFSNYVHFYVFGGVLFFLGFPGVPGPTDQVRQGPEMHIFAPNCGSGMTHPFWNMLSHPWTPDKPGTDREKKKISTTKNGSTLFSNTVRVSASPFTNLAGANAIWEYSIGGAPPLTKIGNLVRGSPHQIWWGDRQRVEEEEDISWVLSS